MSTEQEPSVKQFQINDSLPTLYVDGVRFQSRADGVNLVRFTANLPDSIREQVRLMINDKDLHRILDVLCQSTKYYPEKSSETKDIPETSNRTRFKSQR